MKEKIISKITLILSDMDLITLQAILNVVTNMKRKRA